MPPLPTMSLRVAPDRQALMRAIARILKDSPGVAAELQGVLQNVLQRNTQHGITQCTTSDAVLHDVLQRLAALEQCQAALERRAPEEGPADSVSPAGRKPEGATDGGPFVAGDVPEGPAFPKESEGTLWQGTGSTRRLTAHGRQVLAGMVTTGLPLAEMAARSAGYSQGRRPWPGSRKTRKPDLPDAAGRMISQVCEASSAT